MIALGLLLTIFFPYMAHSKEIHIEKTQSTVEAWLGQNSTIPCVLAKDADQELELDLPTVGVRWSKMLPNGREMDIYKFTGHSHVEIRPGSLIDEKELKRGNASLTLHHVLGGDEGEYTCTVYVTPEKASATINVMVLVKPDITLSTTELTTEPGSKDSVICEVSKFYPEAVKIQWGKYNKSSGTWSLLDKPTYRTVPEKNRDGSFNVSSQLILEPSSPEENGDVYCCVVTHASFSHDQNVSFTLTVKELPRNCFSELTINSLSFGFLVLLVLVAGRFITVSPQVSEIVGVDDLVHMKRSTLAFNVSGFKPKNIEINLYIKIAKGMENHKIQSWKYPPPQQVKQCKEDIRKGEFLTPSYKEKDSFLEKKIQPLKPMRSLMVYSCMCSTHIIPDKERDEGAELVIEVKHASLKCPLTVYQKMNISEAEPVGKPIPFKHGQHQVGQ